MQHTKHACCVCACVLHDALQQSYTHVNTHSVASVAEALTHTCTARMDTACTRTLAQHVWTLHANSLIRHITYTTHVHPGTRTLCDVVDRPHASRKGFGVACVCISCTTVSQARPQKLVNTQLALALLRSVSGTTVPGPRSTPTATASRPVSHRCRCCRFAAPPSPFCRWCNMKGEGVSALAALSFCRGALSQSREKERECVSDDQPWADTSSAEFRWVSLASRWREGGRGGGGEDGRREERREGRRRISAR